MKKMIISSNIKNHIAISARMIAVRDCFKNNAALLPNLYSNVLSFMLFLSLMIMTCYHSLNLFNMAFLCHPILFPSPFHALVGLSLLDDHLVSRVRKQIQIRPFQSIIIKSSKNEGKVFVDLLYWAWGWGEYTRG